MVIQPWGPQGIVYAAHDSKGEVPAPSLDAWDKTSAEITRVFDLTDFYINVSVDEEGNEVISGAGPRNITVDAAGIWTSTWAKSDILHMNHDGDVLWVNRIGDHYGESISNEDAAAIGMSGGSISTNMQMATAHSGVGGMLFMASYNNQRGAHFSGYGRDGAGLLDVIMSSSVGPFRPITTWFLTIVDDKRGPYDGAYISGHYYWITREFGAPEEGKRGPGALMYIPLDVASRRLGAAVTAVEETENAGTPDSYSLGQAYPNPFNSETAIEFSLPSEEHVKIEVYNTVGQQVASLVEETLSAGVYKTAWDGLDRAGQKVSSGVYFYRMQAGDFTDTRSMSLLK